MCVKVFMSLLVFLSVHPGVFDAVFLVQMVLNLLVLSLFHVYLYKERLPHEM